MTEPIRVLQWLFDFNRPASGGTYVVTYNPVTGYLELYPERMPDRPKGLRHVITLSGNAINKGLSDEAWNEARRNLAAVSKPEWKCPQSALATTCCQNCSSFFPDAEVIVLHGSTGGGLCQRDRRRTRSGDYCECYGRPVDCQAEEETPPLPFSETLPRMSIPQQNGETQIEPPFEEPAFGGSESHSRAIQRGGEAPS